MQMAPGEMRWARRRAMEEMMAWGAARCRLREVGTPQAWCLVVEAAWRQVRSDLEDHEGSHEAQRLQANAADLRAHVPELIGVPDAGDLLAEMKALEAAWLKQMGSGVES